MQLFCHQAGLPGAGLPLQGWFWSASPRLACEASQLCTALLAYRALLALLASPTILILIINVILIVVITITKKYLKYYPKDIVS
jgi:hypothetical protein